MKATDEEDVLEPVETIEAIKNEETIEQESKVVSAKYTRPPAFQRA
jgi:hypothetical protein